MTPRTREGPAAIEAVVLGGSAGSMEVLTAVLPALPAGLAVPVITVLHVAPDKPSLLVEVYRPRLAVPVDEAADKAPIAPGVWFAPPGYHLHVERDRHFALSVDPPVHHSRPSIDVLFESAARAYGPGLTAVLLSGASVDGADGLAAVLREGGVARAQAPRTASAITMPAAGLRAGAQPWTPDELRAFLAGLRVGKS